MPLFRLILFMAAAAVPLMAQNSFPALLADKPYPEYKEKLELFGQFVGSWVIEGKEYNDDGTVSATDKGEICFQWVLEGRAVQDVWVENHRSDANPKVYGTTVRFYDPKTDAWQVTWIDPVHGVVKPLIGHKVGAQIVMKGRAANADRIRWIFSDIKPDSFHWRGERLSGKRWRTYEEVSARRKS